VACRKKPNFFPEFIFEETSAQADVLRNVLVIDNLEEQTFIPLKSGPRPVFN
jgi:hypothetical protein